MRSTVRLQLVALGVLLVLVISLSGCTERIRYGADVPAVLRGGPGHYRLSGQVLTDRTGSDGVRLLTVSETATATAVLKVMVRPDVDTVNQSLAGREIIIDGTYDGSSLDAVAIIVRSSGPYDPGPAK